MLFLSILSPNEVISPVVGMKTTPWKLQIWPTTCHDYHCFFNAVLTGHLGCVWGRKSLNNSMHTGFYFFAPPPLARYSRFALPFASVRLRFLEEMTLGTGLEKRNGAISYQEPARLQLPGLNSTLPFFPLCFFNCK